MPSSVKRAANALPSRRSTALQKVRSMASMFMAFLSCWINSPDLGDRPEQPRDVLRPRQAVIAVLDHGQHHVLRRQPVRQPQRMLPGHVLILRALQDANRASDIDGSSEN